MIGRCVLAALALVLAVASTPAGATKPQRIISLNLCTDQILIDLVPASRIRALSHVAGDASVSSIAARAA
jgi:iron complex transport system substrate-binding protein